MVWNGFVVGPGTAVEGVELLWPGRLLEFDPVRRVGQGPHQLRITRQFPPRRPPVGQNPPPGDFPSPGFLIHVTVLGGTSPER